MPVIIKVKNKTNWIVTFILGYGLIITLFIILCIIPFTIHEENYLLSIFNYISSIIPFAGFFFIFLYIWLWNTFGKTILTIEPDAITVRYKNDLFSRTRTYLKKDIDRVQTKDFKVERYKLGVRYHFSLSSPTYSVILIEDNREVRMVDWITQDKADEIVDTIKKVWD
ncbi:hypothetical protein LF887_20605 [Chryseobacterium sp. MEBOG06]|uniref:hypothetical protein n=1 Tax=unclassified Chryseobacterium TaxID=2593645 RepID=UPI001F43D7FA|nr:MULTISPECIES: hypothetical protein [unclassified Chryseobacterium]UKB83388.1 hypothetical protein LF887_20605 [Chryseobacterium sp. MEBOG06]